MLDLERLVSVSKTQYSQDLLRKDVSITFVGIVKFLPLLVLYVSNVCLCCVLKDAACTHNAAHHCIGYRIAGAKQRR